MRSGAAALALRVRKRLPEPVRQALRVLREVVTPSPGASPEVPPELFEGCQVCGSRFELAARLPRNGRVVEVGTDRGDYARHILDKASPTELHIIDLDLSGLAPSVRGDPRVILQEGYSDEVLATLPDNAFDWIYIDASHAYPNVVRDAAAAADKVKSGGYLVFNDFSHIDPYLGRYGVHRAVCEFAVARRWRFAWMAFAPNAQYDVALRKP